MLLLKNFIGLQKLFYNSFYLVMILVLAYSSRKSCDSFWIGSVENILIDEMTDRLHVGCILALVAAVEDV